MSYADVTSRHTDGPQPHPNPALLNTTPSTATGVPDVDKKITIVPYGSQEHPVTEIYPIDEPFPSKHEAPRKTGTGHHDASERRKEKAKKAFNEAEQEGFQLWSEAKERLLRPGTLGGLVGLVNVGLIGTLGYQLYTKPLLRSDTRFLATASVSTILLLGAEGYVAEAYRQTAAGQEEERKAREEGAVLYRRTKDIVLRPGVLGGLVGIANLGILGGVGYVSYVHWNQPHWDRRTVSVVTVGLITLFAGEGFLAEQYKEKEYPKRK